MVLLALLVPVARVLGFPWNLLGLVPVLLGAAINVLADRQFKRAGTTVKPFEVSSALVTDGIFRFTRNPMYLGMLCMLVGVAMLLRELTPWLVAPVFAAVMQSVFVRSEERMLEEHFGEAWRAYAARVRQWI
jgi:protein-S-isoprenylcysteine O-methyltransferase Ste14